jgi:DNA-binding transcriptional MerR regulator
MTVTQHAIVYTSIDFNTLPLWVQMSPEPKNIVLRLAITAHAVHRIYQEAGIAPATASWENLSPEGVKHYVSLVIDALKDPVLDPQREIYETAIVNTILAEAYMLLADQAVQVYQALSVHDLKVSDIRDRLDALETTEEQVASMEHDLESMESRKDDLAVDLREAQDQIRELQRELHDKDALNETLQDTIKNLEESVESLESEAFALRQALEGEG